MNQELWGLVGAGLVGLIVGSFLNVLIVRFGTGQTLWGRSHCPHCQKTLRWWELIPIVSFLFLGGRCARCRKPISWRYPIIELASGLGTALIVGWQGIGLAGLGLLVAFWAALVIVGIDLAQMVIPDLAVVSIGLGALLWQFGRGLLPEQAATNLLLGALIGLALPLLLIIVSSGKGMGVGDMKLAAALGALVGGPLAFVFLTMAVLLGSLVGSLLLIFRRAHWHQAIAFGPFLLVGAVFSMIWGQTLLDWYLGFL